MESTSLAEALGVAEDFAPDWMAPPVDREFIREFVRDELVGDDREQAIDYIASFRPWRVGLQDVLREGMGRPGITPAGPEV